jgi:hypothetical protein
VPAELGLLAELQTLSLARNLLTAVPAELGKLSAGGLYTSNPVVTHKSLKARMVSTLEPMK